MIEIVFEFNLFLYLEKTAAAPVPAAVISSEYDAEDDEGDSDEENDPQIASAKEANKLEVTVLE